MRTSCQVDTRFFPFDTQTCRIKIGSWTYDGFALDVQPESYTMDISKSPSNLEWELVSTSVKREVQTYSCCPEPYPDVTYTLTIKRRHQSYGVNFLFPALFLTALTLMAFVTPTERISLILTCLVSMFFFLKMVAERTPTSDTTPLLSIYYVMLSFEITLIFYAMCLTMNAYHRHPYLGNMSRCVRGIVMQRLGRIWGVGEIHSEIQQRLESLQEMANVAKEEYRNFEEMETLDALENNDHSRNYNRERTNVELANSTQEDGVKVNQVERESNNIRSRIESHKTFEDSRDFSSSSQPRFRSKKQVPSSASVTSIEGSSSTEQHSRVAPKPYLKIQSSDVQLNIQNFQPLHYCDCESCKIRPTRTRCSAFLNEMTALNHRLISNVQEINYLARKWDYKSSLKEDWLVAASILDKAFFLVFLIFFSCLYFV